MQIGRRVYYDKSTGNVLVNTGEKNGDVTSTTVAQDFQTYTALSGLVPSNVGMMELPYGHLVQDFMTCVGLRVNLSTLDLEFSYDEDTASTTPVYQKPLSEQVNELKSQNAQIILALVMNDLM